MREFFYLTKRSNSLSEYVVHFRHLKRYYPYAFNSELEHTGKFIWSLNEGVRVKVISSRIETLSSTIEMAIKLDEDFVRAYDVGT